MDTSGIEVQNKVFFYLKKELKSNELVVKWLKEHLKISRASAYRRIDGSIILKITELMFIVNHFKIPLTELFDAPNDLIYFYFENNKPNSYEEWMKKTYGNFSEACSLPNVLMYYTSTENQIFYHFHFKELTYFKLYIWARAMWDLPGPEDPPFDLTSELWTPKVDEYRLKMLETYTRLPSIEFWTPNIMNNNLSQIEYYLSSYQFKNPADAQLLCQQLRDMVSLLLKQTKNERKVPVGDMKKEETASFELYFNKTIHTNNTLLFTSDERNAVYTTFGNPTMIKTQQATACNHTKNWFNRLKRISNKISYSDEKERSRIMRNINTKISEAEETFERIKLTY